MEPEGSLLYSKEATTRPYLLVGTLFEDVNELFYPCHKIYANLKNVSCSLQMLMKLHFELLMFLKDTPWLIVFMMIAVHCLVF